MHVSVKGETWRNPHVRLYEYTNGFGIEFTQYYWSAFGMLPLGLMAKVYRWWLKQP